MPPLWRALLPLLRILPQRLLSRFWGRVSRLQFPSIIQSRINCGFATVFHVDLTEAESPPEDYPSLSAFFVRRHREGVRDWPGDRRVLASPADGVLGTFGQLDQGTALQAKGISYRVRDLLDDDTEAEPFRSGLFLTIYLSPRHYHRVHAPCAAGLHASRVVPGRLLPVNPSALRLLPGLLSANERMVTLLQADLVDLAVVAVGAYNVGSISSDFDPDRDAGVYQGVTNLRTPREPATQFYDPPLSLEPGDPLMTFHLGSTVILLVSPRDGSVLTLHPSLQSGSEIRIGTPLLGARILRPPPGPGRA